jgi:LmbE family N-acetylglucosaminyl deacetylase
MGGGYGRAVLRALVDRLQRQRAAGWARDLEPEMATRSALVLAPHQDDETLGCGGTIALKRRAGADVTIVFLMDGTRSHVPLIEPQELAALRHAEACAAAARLGVDAEHVVFLDFPEGKLGRFLDAAAERLADVLARTLPDEVFVTAAAEPHKEHAAANTVARRALDRAGQVSTVYEYPVWCWYHWPSVPLPLTPRVIGPSRFRYEMPRVVANTRLMSFGAGIHRDFPDRVRIDEVLAVKRAALEEHRSQMTRLRSTPKWATLADVGGGAFLECFFTGEERFRRYTHRPGQLADAGG